MARKKPKTLAQVSRKVDSIDAYLARLSRFLRKVNWKKVPHKRNGGHGQPGGNVPPWPPR